MNASLVMGLPPCLLPFVFLCIGELFPYILLLSGQRQNLLGKGMIRTAASFLMRPIQPALSLRFSGSLTGTISLMQ
jgi:hypothetical protein